MKTPKNDKYESRGRQIGNRIKSNENGRGRPKGDQPKAGTPTQDGASAGSKMKKVNLWITNDQDDFLNRLKDVTGLDKSEHHRRAMDLYRDYIETLKQSPKQRRGLDSQFEFLKGKEVSE